MIEAHLLVPPNIASNLSARFVLRHKRGEFGYFVSLTDSEFWSIARSLVSNGYRVDIKPGSIVKLMVRYEK